MFRFLRKKKPALAITPEDKEWVEERFIGLMQTFGLGQLTEAPFIAPTADEFPYNDLKDPHQFQQLFGQLCGYWQIDPEEVEVRLFDDLRSKQWSTWIYRKGEEPLGRYTQQYTRNEKRFRVELAKSNLDAPQLLIAVLAHELCHVKLLGGRYIRCDAPDMEPFTDLACIWFGFGVILANTYITHHRNWMGRNGYLPGQVISYANALICYLTDAAPGPYRALLNINTREWFQQHYDYLKSTNNTQLVPTKVQECLSAFQYTGRVKRGFAEKQFGDVVAACRERLQQAPKKAAIWNSLGYALLELKQYNEAIEAFTKAIDLSPYWPYPYNNRGYCRLQLGDPENAFADIDSSLQMNPANSFAWRNMDAWYLAAGEPAKALEYLEEADRIDPKTELIQFYLGHAAARAGHTARAKAHFAQSVARQEHNDSMLPGPDTY